VSGVLDAGLRPLRVFATLMLVAGVGMLVAATVVVLHGVTKDVEPVATGSAGQAMTLPAGGGTLHVLASRAGRAPFTARDTCRVQPRHVGTQVTIDTWPRSLTRDGVTYRSFRSVQGWRSGDTVTCAGPAVGQVLVVKDSRASTLLMAGLFGVAGAGGVLLGVVGRRARRADRTSGPGRRP
jgi:hypothetical protein